MFTYGMGDRGCPSPYFSEICIKMMVLEFVSSFKMEPASTTQPNFVQHSAIEEALILQFVRDVSVKLELAQLPTSQYPTHFGGVAAHSPYKPGKSPSLSAKPPRVRSPSSPEQN